MKVRIKTRIWERPSTEVVISVATFYAAISTMFALYGLYIHQYGYLLHWIINVGFWTLMTVSRNRYQQEHEES